jgi:hypothetical protein
MDGSMMSLMPLVEVDTSIEPHLCQDIHAPQSPTGNPRRARIIYSATGEILDVFDCGYGGYPRWSNQLYQLPGMKVTVSEYKTFVNDLATARWRT